MEVNLRPDQEEYLEQAIKDGLFSSTDEAIQHALDQLEDHPSRPTTASKPALSIQTLIAALQAFPDDELCFEHDSILAPINPPVSF